MAKPYRLKELEKKHGPLEQVIPPLVNKLGSQKAAAEKLGVSTATICIWLRENHYRSKTIVTKGEKTS